MSETGALIEGAALPSVGEALILRRLQLQIGAVVIWRHAGRCGIKFERTASTDEWIAGVAQPPAAISAGQARVDRIQTAVRSGAAIPDEDLVRGECASPATVEKRIGEEIAFVLRLFDAVGDDLTGDPILLQRHARNLQNFDLACQILQQLGAVLVAEDRVAAVQHVSLAELRARLIRS
jgi:hypothetical protein